ncbi:DUF4276 family protein [Candidatus Poribacteria bacterium]|nr:DUF4276 family protein [Candidatus Poribacteria bacterium]
MRWTLFIEGGGNTDAVKRQCREAFTELFKKARFEGAMPRVVACGSRAQAYKDFVRAVSTRGEGEIAVLLIGSESPVQKGAGKWAHLATGKQDQWSQPNGTSEDDVFLMVQLMETWLLADPSAWKQVLGADFNESKVPDWPDMEAIGKEKILSTISAATSGYTKGAISWRVLAHVKPAELETRLPHAADFFQTMQRRVKPAP